MEMLPVKGVGTEPRPPTLAGIRSNAAMANPRKTDDDKKGEKKGGGCGSGLPA